MPRVTVKNSISSTIAKWSIIYVWRFFTGAHLNGKTYNDSTFWKNATKRGQPRKRTWWKAKARYKRMLWRNGCFWPLVVITAGFLWSASSMWLIIAALMPFLLYVGYHRLRKTIAIPIVAKGADGVPQQAYVLRPQVRRFLDRVRGKQYKPGMITQAIIDEAKTQIPPEIATAIVGENIARKRGPVTRMPTRVQLPKQRTEW